MVGNGHEMMACLESGGPCDSWLSVVGGTNGWQLVASGHLSMVWSTFLDLIWMLNGAIVNISI